MKKVFILSITILSFMFVARAAMADEVIIINEDFSNINYWQTTGTVSGNDGKLIVESENSNSQTSAYKYNGTKPKTYLRTAIGENYKVETVIEVSDFFEGGTDKGYSAGLNVINLKYEMGLYIEKDGLYALTKNGKQKLYDGEIDNQPHTYMVSVSDSEAEVYMDGQFTFSYDLPKNTGNDDIKFSTKGSAEDKAEFKADYIKLFKVYSENVLFDDLKNFDKTEEYSNVEYNNNCGEFFSGTHQVDLIDYKNTEGGYVTYKIPDNAEMTGYLISARKDTGNLQGRIVLYFSKDGSTWTKSLNDKQYRYEWFYASGGHRYLITPPTDFDFEDAKYIKIVLKREEGSSYNEASDISPALMNVEIMYMIPEFINAEADGKELGSGVYIPASTKEISLNFSADVGKTDLDNAVKLYENDKEIEVEITSDGKKISIDVGGKLKFGTQYSLSIDKSITTTGGTTFERLPKSYEFTTYENDFSMGKVNFYEEGNVIGAEAEITNTTGERQNITLIIIGYKDGMMSGFNSKSVSLNNMQKLSVKTGNIDSNCDSIEVMLWDSIENMTVLAPKYVK